MKTKLVFTVVLTSFLLLYGCSDNEDIDQDSSAAERSSVIDQQYPQAQAEVLETFQAIAESITAGAGHGYNGEYIIVLENLKEVFFPKKK